MLMRSWLFGEVGCYYHDVPSFNAVTRFFWPPRRLSFFLSAACRAAGRGGAQEGVSGGVLTFNKQMTSVKAMARTGDQRVDPPNS